jgi:outer membrane protein TolC
LTLQDAIRMALQKNLDVRVEAYNPAVADTDIRKSYGIYDRVVSGLTDYRDASTPSAVESADGSHLGVLRSNASIGQLFPAGGTLSVEFDNARTDGGAGSTRAVLRDYYLSSLTVNFNQPLLKNFGRDMTELGIVVARNGKEASLELFKSKLVDTVARVRTEYFKLFSLQGNLEAKQTSLAVARKVLEETKGRVKAGMLPAMEILNAEFGVASREKDVIDAERAVRDEVDVLGLLLQLDGVRTIVPVDAPSKERYSVVEDDAVGRAMEERADLRAQRVNLKTQGLQVEAARNRTLPDLALTATAGLAGLDKEYANNLEKLSKGDYPVWGVGVQFTYPLGNTAAQNDYLRNKLLGDQTRAQIRSLEASIRNDVRAAIRGIETSFKQLEVTERGRSYAEETLRAYLKKQEVGMATTKDVLDVESSVAVARTNQIQALVDYNNSITALWQSTGEILERERVSVADAAPDITAPGR